MRSFVAEKLFCLFLGETSSAKSKSRPPPFRSNYNDDTIAHNPDHFCWLPLGEPRSKLVYISYCDGVYLDDCYDGAFAAVAVAAI